MKRIGRLIKLVAAPLALVLLVSMVAHGQDKSALACRQRHPVDRRFHPGGNRDGQARLQGCAGQSAGGVYREQSASRRVRFSQHREWPRKKFAGRQSGRPCARSGWDNRAVARGWFSTSQRWSSTKPRWKAMRSSLRWRAERRRILHTTDSTTAFAEPKASGEGHAVRDIDFRRGQKWRGADYRRSFRCDHRDRSAPAGKERSGRLHPDRFAASTGAALRRHRLRHPGRQFRSRPFRGQHPYNAYAERPLGAVGLPDGQPLHHRGKASGRGGRQAEGFQRLYRREAVVELSEHRGACGIAGDRRFHEPQYHYQRYGKRQPYLAPQGRALGSGAGHHSAGQGPGYAQDRQRGLDCAAR